MMEQENSIPDCTIKHKKKIVSISAIALFLLSSMAMASEKRHGISFFGDLKYPPHFKHFEYVNPNAPKLGTIRIPQLGTFDTLNDFIRKGRKAAGLNDTSCTIYDRLLADADDEPSSQYGWLAESVELADDFSWVAFGIRPEARWHDGVPLTAEDVIFTFNHLKKYGSPSRKVSYRDIIKAAKTGPNQVTFYFMNADSPKLAQTIGRMQIIPEHYWRDRNFDQTTLEIPMGSGPYRVAHVDPGKSITFVLVEDYWGRNLPVNVGRYNIRKIIFDYFRDESIIHEAHKAGVVDVKLETVAKRWAEEYDFPGYRDGMFVKDLIYTERPAGMSYGVAFNLRRKKFQDIRVREALHLAYDFEWSNRVLYHDFYARGTSFFENSDLAASGLPSEEELALLEPFRDQIPPRVFTQAYQVSITDGYGYARENLLKAAALLKESGWVVRDNVRVHKDTGEPFMIEFITVSVYLERALMPFINAIKRLGIDCPIKTIEVSQYTNRVGNRDFDATVTNYPQTLTPGVELFSYWGSNSAAQKYSYNTAGISNPVVDNLIAHIINAKNRPELIVAARALDRVLLWNFYIIPGYWPPGYRYGYWDKFVKPNIQARYRSGYFDTWWIDMEKAKQIEAYIKGQRSENEN